MDLYLWKTFRVILAWDDLLSLREHFTQRASGLGLVGQLFCLHWFACSTSRAGDNLLHPMANILDTSTLLNFFRGCWCW